MNTRYFPTGREQERAVLVGLTLRPYRKQDTESHLQELAFLAETAGAKPVKQFIQQLSKPNSARVNFSPCARWSVIQRSNSEGPLRSTATIKNNTKSRKSPTVIRRRHHGVFGAMAWSVASSPAMTITGCLKLAVIHEGTS